MRRRLLPSSSRVVLSQGGTYLLSGTLEDAQLVLDAPAGETVRLVLRGVNMHFEHGPVILSKGTGTVVLVLEDGTENTITDGRTYLYTTAAAGQEAVVSTGGDLLITGGAAFRCRRRTMTPFAAEGLFAWREEMLPSPHGGTGSSERKA